MSRNKFNKIETTEYLRDGRAPIPEREATSQIMRSIKAKNTKPELKLRASLWQKGIRGYRLHWNKVPGKPDITFPGKKIAIFVNGCFWHRCPYCKPPVPKSHANFWKEKFRKNMERDKRKIEALNALGWNALTFWECQVMKQTDEIVRNISKELSQNIK